MTDDIINPDEREQPLEPRLQEAARAYNPPPATPREAMWERIAAARAHAPASDTPSVVAPLTAPVAPDTRVISIDAARARRRPVRTWAILAGTLAAGIAMGVFGRDVFKTDAHVTPNVVARAGDTTHKDTGATRTTNVAANETPTNGIKGNTPSTPPKGVLLPQAPSEGNVATIGGPPPKNNSARDRAPHITPRTRDESFPSQPNALYAAAAVQTLSQAEALLVAWRVDAPRDSAAARQLGTWARDVLGSTRLLLDSPAANDPRLRNLLDDLELVLAQIVQLSGAPLTEAERTLLERSVKERDLLPRIRSAVPAGLSGSATSI